MVACLLLLCANSLIPRPSVHTSPPLPFLLGIWTWDYCPRTYRFACPCWIQKFFYEFTLLASLLRVYCCHSSCHSQNQRQCDGIWNSTLSQVHLQNTPFLSAQYNDSIVHIDCHIHFHVDRRQREPSPFFLFLFQFMANGWGWGAHTLQKRRMTMWDWFKRGKNGILCWCRCGSGGEGREIFLRNRRPACCPFLWREHPSNVRFEPPVNGHCCCARLRSGTYWDWAGKVFDITPLGTL